MYQHIVLSHATPQRTHAPHVRQTTHVPQATRCLTHIQRFTAHSGVMSRAPQRQRQCKSHSAAAAAPRVVGEKACCCASAPERSPSGSSQHTSAYVSMRIHTHIYIYIYIYIYIHTHTQAHTFCCAAVGEKAVDEGKAFCSGGEIEETGICLARESEACLTDKAFWVWGHIYSS
jgi:hypothetical protein